MGRLVAGRWTDEESSIADGAFVRRASVFRDELGSDTVAAFRSQPGRFHLVASLSCPWSHRTIILRRLKGLEQAVPLHIAGGRRVQGYPVNGGRPWRVPGTDDRIHHLHELYTLSDPDYTGGATVPVLWDSQRRRIASNESAAIMRAFDAAPVTDDGSAAPAADDGSAADGSADGGFDFTLVPDGLRGEIDALNAELHEDLSNAVYRAGLARRQDAYDEAVARVFATLDMLEMRLAGRRYLFGATITESDWRLFPTLVRFDAVYHTHFRCSRRRLVDYANLWPYARDLHAWRDVAGSVDFDAIREGYYRNDGDRNPFGIVAILPDADWRAPHGREALGPARVALRGGGTRGIEPGTLRPTGD